MDTPIASFADKLPPSLSLPPRPRIDFPWPSACAPNAEQIESAMLDWAQSHGLFINEAHRRYAAEARCAWLAARCYPHAERRLLQVLANYIACLFLTDDILIDHIHGVSAATVPPLAAILDAVDFNRLSEHPTYGESAWLDVCQQLRQLLPAEHFERFANGIRLWATAAGLQILVHLNGEPPAMQTYIPIRRYIGGMYSTLALIDPANAAPLSAAVHCRPDVQQLDLHINNIVCWCNDIHSLAAEMKQPGHFWSMVTVYAAQDGSLRHAIESTTTRIQTEIDQFLALAATVEQSAEQSLRVYIAGMKDWVRGYLDWVEHDTRRYLPPLTEKSMEDQAPTLLV